MILMMRKQIIYNNDRQRRCYNGCHFSTDTYWSEWESLGHVKGDGQSALKYFRELNDYAVTQRGESARCEYKLVN